MNLKFTQFLLYFLNLKLKSTFVLKLKEMNPILKALLKLCTTKNFFKDPIFLFCTF